MAQGNDTTGSKTEGAAGKAKQEAETYAAKASALGQEAAHQVGDAADKARRSVKRTARSLAHDAEEQIEGLADRQINYGADLVGKFAEALRAASEVLEDDLPPLATAGYGTAERIDDFADSVRAQSAGDLFGTATEIARRRPAVLLGAAAALGFILYRAANATARAEDHEPAPSAAPATPQGGGPVMPSSSPAGASAASPSPAPAKPSTPSPANPSTPSPASPSTSSPAKPSASGGQNGA